jgi:hypothetical protein
MKINELIDEDGQLIKPDWKVGLTPEDISYIENRLNNDPALQRCRKLLKDLESYAKKYED